MAPLSCCVNGCNNSSKSKRKFPGSMVSFHAFPSKTELRLQWLHAIGKTDESVPNDARVCSWHFSADKLIKANNVLGLKSDAVPTLLLHPLSHTSSPLACRICLATNVKLHSLENKLLKICMDNIKGFSNLVNGLPQYVCYECAALLIKSYRLVEKSRIAQIALLDIYSQHGMIDIKLIEKQNRSALNLKSSLQIDKTSTEIIEYVYDEEENTPLIFIKSDSVEQDFSNSKGIEEETVKVEVKEEQIEMEEDLHNGYESSVEEINDSVPSQDITSCNRDVIISLKKNKKPTKRKSKDEIIDDSWREHFDIVKLTLEEQKIEKRKLKAEGSTGKGSLQCDACSKSFRRKGAIELRHLTVHDPRLEGTVCEACKRVCGASRARCRYCHTRYKDINTAMAHYRSEHWSDHNAKCTLHDQVRCKQLECQPRNVANMSDEAGKISTNDNMKTEITINQCNQKQSDTEMVVPSKCDICGLEFKSARKLKGHLRDEHGVRKNGLMKEKRKRTWTRPGDQYPTKCEHCDTMLNNRKEHWAHVRKIHPTEKGNYKSVITAICEQCGQGFQNAARLRLHELRHGPPTVQCSLCDKKFYDKFLLGVHMETHSELRPYRCHTCGRGFKTKSNLDKHHRTHSDVAAYECSLCGKRFKYSTSLNLHIRTVHHKIPLPPRKRRSKKNLTDDSVKGI